MQRSIEELDARLEEALGKLEAGNIGYDDTKRLTESFTGREIEGRIIDRLFSEIVRLSRLNLAISCPFLCFQAEKEERGD